MAVWTAKLANDPTVDFNLGSVVLRVDYFDSGDTTFTNILYSKNFLFTPPLVLGDIVAAVRSEGQRVRGLLDALGTLSPQVHTGATVNVP